MIFRPVKSRPVFHYSPLDQGPGLGKLLPSLSRMGRKAQDEQQEGAGDFCHYSSILRFSDTLQPESNLFVRRLNWAQNILAPTHDSI